MLQSDILKLKVLKLLKEKPMTLGQLKRATKTPHHYTILHAIEFLEKLGLVTTEKLHDKRNTKLVKRTNHLLQSDFLE